MTKNEVFTFPSVYLLYKFRFWFYLAGGILPAVIQGSNANSVAFFLQFHQNNSLLTTRNCFSFLKASVQKHLPHQPELCILTSFSLHFFGFHCGLCRICVHPFIISDKVTFWRDNELPDVTKQSQELWDFCAFIKLGQLWGSFSTHWLSNHFSKGWQHKTSINKQLLEHSKHK